MATEGQLDATVAELAAQIAKIEANVTSVVEGKQNVVRLALIALLAEGHLLLEDVPGVGKTLLAKAIGRSIDCTVRRVQFTPDLLPSDITGVTVYNQERGTFEFKPGAVFANIVLGDEINRAGPKTQSALLEAMEERTVSLDGVTHELDVPFMVIATQNPIELEGTYPLPEAQLDRFMFEIVLDHLPEEEELAVVRSTTAILEPEFSHVITGADILAFQRLVRKVPVADPVLRYALALVRATRPNAPGAPEFIRKWVQFGASVRAAQFLVLGAKARALTQGRYAVSFDDIRALAHPVLRHRILRNFHAESERITTDWLVDQLLEAVPVPRSGM